MFDRVAHPNMRSKAKESIYFKVIIKSNGRYRTNEFTIKNANTSRDVEQIQVVLDPIPGEESTCSETRSSGGEIDISVEYDSCSSEGASEVSGSDTSRSSSSSSSTKSVSPSSSESSLSATEIARKMPSSLEPTGKHPNGIPRHIFADTRSNSSLALLKIAELELLSDRLDFNDSEVFQETLVSL
jgi:hypothetical protein